MKTSYFDENEMVQRLWECYLQQCEENKLQQVDAVSPYTSSINRYIRTQQELGIYTRLNLVEGYVTRPSLLFSIDPQYAHDGITTNLKRMLNGKAPFDAETGQIFKLHHIGQQYDSPFAELPEAAHRSTATYSILHHTNIVSWRRDKQLVLKHGKEVARHWRLRGEMLRDET